MRSLSDLERAIQLGQDITTARERRAQVAAELDNCDKQIAGMLAELDQLMSRGGNGGRLAAHQISLPSAPDKPEAKTTRKDRASAGVSYHNGSVAHRILWALYEHPEGLNGADISAKAVAENRQVHSQLSSRLVPAGHVERRDPKKGTGSVYVITDAGRKAYQSAKEGGTRDDSKSTAKND